MIPLVQVQAAPHALWSPKSIPRSNLRHWWCAEDYASLMTDDGAGRISSWTDRVGGQAVTGTTTARPTYGAAAFNAAYPGLTFDGVANTLAWATLSGQLVSITAASAGELWAVYNTPVTPPASMRIAGYGGTSGATMRQIGATTSAVLVYDGATTCLGGAPAGYHITGGAWHGTVEEGRDNGTALANSTIATLNTGTTRLRLGASTLTTASQFAAMVLSDVIIIAGTLSTLDRQRLEAWFAWNRGLQSILPSDHPFKLQRP